MRKTGTCALLALCFILGAAAARAQGPRVCFHLDQNWGTGFQGTITLTNAGTNAISNWTLEFDLPHNVTSMWDAHVTTHTGNHYVVLNNGWNATIAPGGTAQFGFVAALSGPLTEPTGFRLNGVPTSCNGIPPDAKPPTAPVRPRAANVTATSATLSWTASRDNVGVTGYDVYQGATLIGSPTGTSFTLNALSPNTDYAFTIRARDAAGNVSDPSKPVRFRTRDGGGGTPGAKRVIGYFTEWGIYGRHYLPKNIETSGSAGKLTHINYAFGNVTGGRAAIYDSYAAYDKAFSAEESVDGVADDWNAPNALRGSFNQLRKLKARHPGLKILISLGGWTLSGGFSGAAMTAESRQTLAASAIELFIRGNLPNGMSAAGLFDGIDIDWEYPAECGLQCGVPEDTANFTLLLAEFRRQLDVQGAQDGKRYLLTIAAPAGESKFAKIQRDQIHPYLDFINLMAYDFHGAWENVTNFNAPLYASSSDPTASQHFYADYAVTAYLAAGVPADKIVLGVPFYGRGWQGVPNVNNGLYQTAAGAAPATYEAGVEDYKVLKSLPGFVGHRHPEAQAHWMYNASTGVFWSFDDPASMTNKMNYVKTKVAGGLGGAMFWELSGDDATGSLITAISNGLR